MYNRLITLTVLLLSACTPLVRQAPESTQIASLTPLPANWQPTSSLPIEGNTPEMPQNNPTPSSKLRELAETAKKDLAQRLSIPYTRIELMDAQEVIWPDSSLGCPQPGMFYAEVLTPGYLILLRADGHDYEYHAGRSSDIFYCEKPTPPVPGMPGDV
jgi:hypothetical protein